LLLWRTTRLFPRHTLDPAIAAARLAQPAEHLLIAATTRRTFQMRLRIAAITIYLGILSDTSPGLSPNLGSA
jgi:hypothetical protein